MYPVPPRHRAHPPAFLVFREPGERNANATLAKSFHIYEAHTWAQRYSWVPRELGGGDRGELRIIQSARDEGRGSHCAAKGADSISAVTRGHFTRRVRVLTRAERRDRSRRSAPPLVSPSEIMSDDMRIKRGARHQRASCWTDWEKPHCVATRVESSSVLHNQDARVYICHTWFIDFGHNKSEKLAEIYDFQNFKKKKKKNLIDSDIKH